VRSVDRYVDDLGDLEISHIVGDYVGRETVVSGQIIDILAIEIAVYAYAPNETAPGDIGHRELDLEAGGTTKLYDLAPTTQEARPATFLYFIDLEFDVSALLEFLK
jgi:hypothetical protein